MDLIITQDPSFLAAFLGVILPAGIGPLSTVRDANRNPVIIDGIADIAATPAGDALYLSVTAENKIVLMDPFTGAVSDYATVDAPTYMTVDSNGDLYVATRGTILSPNVGTGTVTKIETATGNQTLVGTSLRLPAGLAVDSTGVLYVIQTGYDYFGAPWNPRLTIVDGDTHTAAAIWGVDTNNSETDLEIDANDRLWWNAKEELWTRHNDVNTGFGGRRGRRYDVSNEGVIYYSYAGGPFAGCDTRSTSQIDRHDFDEPATGVERVAGTNTGVADSSFNYPYGRMCGDRHAIEHTGDRLYIRDQGNDAIRYVSVD